MKKFFVTARGDTTVFDLLSENLPEPYDAETILEAGGVWNDSGERILSPGFRLSRGETILVYVSPFQGLYYTLAEGQVVFEDGDMLAVYKPGDLNVHAVPSSLYYNLSYGVSCYLKNQGITMKPTPVTRLDRVVQGLVLYGKNKEGERILFKLVRQAKVRKWYLGALERGKGIRHIRIRDSILSSNGLTILHPQGRPADTWFVRVGELEMADIFSIFPFTGRRHQIRFHAAHYLGAIVGDHRYGSRCSFKPDEIALMCRGYNLPWKGQHLKIRLPGERVEAFCQTLRRACLLSPAGKNRAISKNST